MNCQEHLVINAFVNILRVKILRTVMDDISRTYSIYMLLQDIMTLHTTFLWKIKKLAIFVDAPIGFGR